MLKVFQAIARLRSRRLEMVQMPRIRRPRCWPLVRPLASRDCEQATATITGGNTAAMQSCRLSHVGGDGGEGRRRKP